MHVHALVTVKSVNTISITMIHLPPFVVSSSRVSSKIQQLLNTLKVQLNVMKIIWFHQLS